MDEHEFANRVVDIVDQTACHIAPRRILAVHRDLRFGRRRDAGHVEEWDGWERELARSVQD